MSNARPSERIMVNNIVATYRLATAQDVEVGRTWYPRAHAIICDWADTFGRSIANVACIVASLSPQCEWKRNLIIAADILSGNPPSIGGSIHSFVRIAERIRDEHATDTVDYFKQGCKVRSFAVNLAGNDQIATVDTHGAQIAAGSPASNLRVDTWARYAPVAEAYCLAATRVHLAPATLQTITWLTWKRLYPQGKKIALRSRW